MSAHPPSGEHRLGDASIVQHLPDVVFRYDRDGRILFVNEAIRQLEGRAPAHYMGRPATEVDPDPAVARQFAAARETVLATGEPVTIDVRRVRPDGDRWFEYRLVPERASDGRIETLLAIGREVTEAHRALDAVRASEARYRALVEATSQVVFGAGPDGQLGGPKDGWLAYTGQVSDPARQAAGGQWLEVVHPDDRVAAWAAWTKALRTGTVYEAQYRLHRHDGAWRTVVARAAPVRDGDGRIAEWIGTVTDVTEAEETRAALEAERAHLAEAQRIARLGSWTWDRATGMTRVSEQWSDIFGVDDEATQAPSAMLRKRLVPEDRERLDRHLAEIDRTRPAESEYRWRIVRSDGETRVVHFRNFWRYDAEGRRVGGTGTFQDVTEQAAAEAEIARQRDLLQESQRLAHVGSWEIDLATGTVMWSEEMSRIFGRPPDAGPLSWQQAYERTIEEDRERVETVFQQGLAAGREVVDAQYRARRFDGTIITVVTRSRQIAGPDGTPVRVVGATQDVSDRARLDEQVRQTQKMDALGLLAGSVAHDFNNLLSAILGGAELARLEIPDTSPAAADLDDIKQAGARAAELTRQLVTFSRKQARVPRTQDLRDRVRHAGKLLRRLLPESVELDVDLAPRPCVIHADAGQVEQVLVNLVVNARDAILAAAGAHHAHEADATTAGLVSVEVGARMVEGAPRPVTAGGPLAPGRYAALAVRDTGVGMSAATVEHIFEPFYTTKPEGQGTGLGLATVFGIVTQSGGAIDVESTPDVGTTFTVLLPMVDAPVDDVEAGASALPVGTETVLLVEDERVVREMAARILERHGYRVVVARHGADAQLAWEEHGGAIDVVVTDLRMPTMGGIALVQWLRAQRPTLPLVLMSGYAKARDDTEAALLEREVFLEKPFTTETLLVRVREAINRARPPRAGS